MLPLSEVPILWGTDRQQEAVRAELDHVLATMEVDAVRLRSIEITTEPEHRLGSFNYATDRVKLDRYVDEPMMRKTTRHEVCHALDAALGWPSETRSGLDLVARHWKDRTTSGIPFGDETNRRNEAFAVICEQGVHGARALLDPCQGLHPDLRAEVAWVLDRMAAVPDLPAATEVISEAVDVGHLENWAVLVKDPEGVQLGTDDQEEQVYVTMDGRVVDEPLHGDRIGRIYDNFVALYGTEPIVGQVFDALKTGAGNVAVVARPRGGSESNLFVRHADGRWANHGCILGDWSFGYDMDRSLVMAWEAEEEEGIVRLERLP
jgi:hypothetical protein